MNFHPILVHFPVAFFTLYSVLELFRVKILTKQTYYFPLKAIFLFLGVVSAGAAALSGKIIEHQFTDKNLVDLHSHIQEGASFVFGLLAIAYFIKWIQISGKLKSPSLVNKFLSLYEHIILETPLVFLFSILGFTLIMIGSAIGGIIAFGPNLDPFTQFISSFLKP